jgi:uncharacterized membrane protein
MKNKNVGYLVVGIAIIIVIIIMIFNAGMRSIVDETCSHGSECTMYDTIKTQTYLSFTIAGLVFIIGLFLVFSRPEEIEKIVVKTKIIKEKKKKLDFSDLEKDERKIVELIQSENGGMFQADLMEKMEIGKVKTTRLLDKLESKQLVERKRRGMNNIVVLRSD